MEARPEPIPLEVVHADDSLLVIDKPVGLVVHPGAGNRSGTLQNALLHRYPELAVLPRAGLVHRLDKDTSGLLLVARTLQSHTVLTAALERREIKRTYRAICQGVLTGGGIIDAPIGRHRRERTKMAVVENGRPARTRYRVVERFRAHTYCELELETGRTHQIRVHMAHIRAPLLGDPVYGGRPKLPPAAGDELRIALQAFRRQALHASSLELAHPQTGAALEFDSPVAADLAALRRAAARGCRGGAPVTHVPGFAPQWPAPPNVRAWVTERGSTARYGTLNLALHVGDDASAVAVNRGRLRAALALPSEPRWLDQVHGTRVLDLDLDREHAPAGDGAVTAAPGVVCAVLTADCLPVLLCSADGRRVGVAHAGWRGLVNGVLAAAVRRVARRSEGPRRLARARDRSSRVRGRRRRARRLRRPRSGRGPPLRAERARPLAGRSLRPRARCPRGRRRARPCTAAGSARIRTRSASFRIAARRPAAEWPRWSGSTPAP